MSSTTMSSTTMSSTTMSSAQGYLDNFARARLNMIESQIRAGGVTNARLLAAMTDLPRENFVPPNQGLLAYAEIDAALSAEINLTGNQARYLLAPLLLARMMDALNIHEGDLALDIGCASGYATAILARLVGMGTVVGLESDEALAAQAVRMLARLDLDNIVIITDQIGEGHPAQGPYDVILLNGASARPPEELAALFAPQLREGGRFVGVFDDGGDIKGQAWLFTKKGDEIISSVLFDARAPILPGFAAKPSGFRFPGISRKSPASVAAVAKPADSSKPETSSAEQKGAQDHWRKKDKIKNGKEILEADSPLHTQKSEASKEEAGLHTETIPADHLSAPRSPRRDKNSPQRKPHSAAAPSQTISAQKPPRKNNRSSAAKQEADSSIFSTAPSASSPAKRAAPRKQNAPSKHIATSPQASASEPDWPDKKEASEKIKKPSSSLASRMAELLELKSPPKTGAAQSDQSASLWPSKTETSLGGEKTQSDKSSKNDEAQKNKSGGDA